MAASLPSGANGTTSSTRNVGSSTIQNRRAATGVLLRSAALGSAPYRRLTLPFESQKKRIPGRLSCTRPSVSSPGSRLTPKKLSRTSSNLLTVGQDTLHRGTTDRVAGRGEKTQ